MRKKITIGLLVLGMGVGGFYFFFRSKIVIPAKAGIQAVNMSQKKVENLIAVIPACFWPGSRFYTKRTWAPAKRLPGRRSYSDRHLKQPDELEKTRREMLAQLNRSKSSSRQLAPPTLPTLIAEPSLPPPAVPPVDERAQGRKKRSVLPMGLVLEDNTVVYESPDEKKILFRMMSGDFVRIFSDSQSQALHIQPGLDIYLAATTKKVEPAGLHLPDQDGWVNKSLLHVFEEEEAKEFLLEVNPITLGNDSSFSTLNFYERAMKNPDPVVHRVIGPRLISLVLLHEDYSTLWGVLYRDADPKIRDAALSSLRGRGVANSRPIIEDLITRLIELTKTRARGETELEVLSILSILEESRHPRVPAALASFIEAWRDTQSPAINDALKQILERR